MSGDEKKIQTTEQETIIEEKKEVQGIKFSIDRSRESKELTDELVKERMEREKLQEQYEQLRQQLEKLQGETGTTKEELEKIQTERDDYKDQLVEFAKQEFEQRKAVLIDRVKKINLDEEKVKAMEEDIQSPQDLDNAYKSLEYFSGLITKAEDEREQAQKALLEQAAKDQASLQNIKRGGGSVQLGEKKKDFVYQGQENVSAYMEAIDDLTERAAKGDAEAERMLDGLWNLAVEKLKAEREDFLAFTIRQCPACGKGIKDGSVCAYCGFDLRERIGLGRDR